MPEDSGSCRYPASGLSGHHHHSISALVIAIGIVILDSLSSSDKIYKSPLNRLPDNASCSSHHHCCVQSSTLATMTPPSRIAFCGLFALLQPLVLAGGYYYKSLALSPRHELESLLSNTSSIFGRSDPRWENATERYQDYAPPQVQLVVQPGVESDIPKIVSICYVTRL